MNQQQENLTKTLLNIVDGNLDAKALFVELYPELHKMAQRYMSFENKADTLAFYEKGKEDFNKFTDSLKAKYTTKEETKWEHFQSEISEAFSHLKQAFDKKS